MTICLSLFVIILACVVEVVSFVLDYFGILHISIPAHVISTLMLVSLLTPYVNFC